MRRSITFWAIIALVAVVSLALFMKRRGDATVLETARVEAASSPTHEVATPPPTVAASPEAAPHDSEHAAPPSRTDDTEPSTWAELLDVRAERLKNVHELAAEEYRPGTNAVLQRLTTFDEAFDALCRAQCHEIAANARMRMFLNEELLLPLRYPPDAEMTAELKLAVQSLRDALTSLKAQGGVPATERYDRYADATDMARDLLLHGSPPGWPSTESPNVYELQRFQSDVRHALLFTDTRVEDISNDIDDLLVVLARRTQRALAYDKALSVGMDAARAIATATKNREAAKLFDSRLLGPFDALVKLVQQDYKACRETAAKAQNVRKPDRVGVDDTAISQLERLWWDVSALHQGFFLDRPTRNDERAFSVQLTRETKEANQFELYADEEHEASARNRKRTDMLAEQMQAEALRDQVKDRNAQQPAPPTQIDGPELSVEQLRERLKNATAAPASPSPRERTPTQWREEFVARLSQFASSSANESTGALDSVLEAHEHLVPDLTLADDLSTPALQDESRYPSSLALAAIDAYAARKSWHRAEGWLGVARDRELMAGIDPSLVKQCEAWSDWMSRLRVLAASGTTAVMQMTNDQAHTGRYGIRQLRIVSIEGSMVKVHVMLNSERVGDATATVSPEGVTLHLEDGRTVLLSKSTEAKGLSRNPFPWGAVAGVAPHVFGASHKGEVTVVYLPPPGSVRLMSCVRGFSENPWEDVGNDGMEGQPGLDPVVLPEADFLVGELCDRSDIMLTGFVTLRDEDRPIPDAKDTWTLVAVCNGKTTTLCTLDRNKNRTCDLSNTHFAVPQGTAVLHLAVTEGAGRRVTIINGRLSPVRMPK